MKRKTKQQKEQFQKAALRQRVADIAAGALGANFDDDGGEFATAEFLERFIPALRSKFEWEREEDGSKCSNGYIFELWNLGRFNNVSSTTDFLFENDVRA